MQTLSKIGLSWLLPLAFLGFWTVLVCLKVVPPSHSAPPWNVAKRLVVLILWKDLLADAGATLIRVVGGVVIGGLLGVVAGIVSAQHRSANQLLSPTIRFLAPIPILVWFPFAIMFFGLGETMKLSLIAMATFFLVYLHSFRATRSVDRDYMELAAVYEKQYWDKVFDIILPFGLPSLFTAIRVSLAIGWVVVMFVEYASQTNVKGIGWFIADANALGRIEDEFAGIVVLGAMGALLDALIAHVEKRTVVWRETLETFLAADEN